MYCSNEAAFSQAPSLKEFDILVFQPDGTPRGEQYMLCPLLLDGECHQSSFLERRRREGIYTYLRSSLLVDRDLWDFKPQGLQLTFHGSEWSTFQLHRLGVC